MNIEDLLFQLTLLPSFHSIYESTFIYSLCDQIGRGNGCTEKQRTSAIRVLKKYSISLGKQLNQNINPFLENPTYKLPMRILTNEKTMKVVDHPMWDKLIKVSFPFNDTIVGTIKSNKPSLGYATWNINDRTWDFSLEEATLKFLYEFSKQYGFTYDDTLSNYFKKVEEILENIEQYTPMLILNKDIPTFKNTSKNIPTLQTNNILEAIFEARKSGITVWDENIENFLTNSDINPVVTDFLNSDLASNFQIDSNITSVDSLTDIIKYLSPTLVIVPGGSELEKTVMFYEFLKSIGIANEEISVLFRMPTGTHKVFNEFVKDNYLNSPISEKTKVIFISCKFPKTIIKSKIKFNGVVHLGITEVHYSVKGMIQNHQNLIYFSPSSRFKGKNIVNL